jgi:hypothetical protein
MVDPRILPTEERVRELTADPKLTQDQANQYADLFMQSGKQAIALMFLERSKDAGRLGRVKESAVASGDAFLLHGIERLSPGLVQPAEWREAGARAMSEGKFLFARDCYEKAGDEEKALAARGAWLKIFPDAVVPPPPSR